MIGTLRNLSDPTQVGPQCAIALCSMLYGVAVAMGALAVAVRLAIRAGRADAVGGTSVGGGVLFGLATLAYSPVLGVVRLLVGLLVQP